MPIQTRLFGIRLFSALLASCAATGAPPSPPSGAPATALATRVTFPRTPLGTLLSLELIDDFNPPRPPPDEPHAQAGARWDAALSGLSGLYYDRPSATLYAISDLSQRYEPRLYAFDVELNESSLRVMPKALHFLRERTPSGLLDDLDAESITGDGRGVFYVGTENALDRPTQPVPRILRVQSDGLVADVLALPDAYLPATEPLPRGTRSNGAFEGITLSPSGRWLTAVIEEPLQQDGDAPTFEHGASVRLLRRDLTSRDQPTEYFYPVEPLQRPPHGTATGGNNGVSELVSLDDQRLLVLERAYVPLAEGHGPNTIRIFETQLPAAPAPPDTPLPVLAKRLVLDLDDIVPQLDPAQQSLDNMEGMTLGPTLPNGDPTLLLVSDDNFRSEQRTVFLAFRLRGTALPAVDLSMQQ